jgi:hypothetical protein
MQMDTLAVEGQEPVLHFWVDRQWDDDTSPEVSFTVERDGGLGCFVFRDAMAPSWQHLAVGVTEIDCIRNAHHRLRHALREHSEHEAPPQD